MILGLGIFAFATFASPPRYDFGTWIEVCSDGEWESISKQTGSFIAVPKDVNTWTKIDPSQSTIKRC